MKDIFQEYHKPLFIIFSACALVTVVFLGIPEDVIAQPGLPNDPTQEVPIDGGLGILAALGGTYAIKKLREKKDV